jgi:hypothetical protein
MHTQRGLALGFRWVITAISILMLGVLSSCGGGGGGGSAPVVPAVDAGVGYFDNVSTAGGADVYSDTANTTPLHIDDFQAMVSGSQLTMVSPSQNLAYYGTFTSLSNKAYTADVKIYKDNAPYGTASLTGTLTAATSITGTLTGNGYGKGTFSLNIGAVGQQADVALIVRNIKTLPLIIWTFNGIAHTTAFTTDATGKITGVYPANITTGNFLNCTITGNIAAIANSALYQVSMTISGCTTIAANGSYTGLAASYMTSFKYDNLVLTLSNGTYSMDGLFK